MYRYYYDKLWAKKNNCFFVCFSFVLKREMSIRPDLLRCEGCQTFPRRAAVSGRADSNAGGTSPTATDGGGPVLSIPQFSGGRR